MGVKSRSRKSFFLSCLFYHSVLALQTLKNFIRFVRSSVCANLCITSVMPPPCWIEVNVALCLFVFRLFSRFRVSEHVAN